GTAGATLSVRRMMRGRKPFGIDYVQRLPASDAARQRLEVILATLNGTLRVHEACTQLGISPQRFDQVRREALSGALHALEAGQAGRPPKAGAGTAAEQAEQVAALQQEVARL